MSGDRFDPITLEVIRNRLDVIAEEMQTTLLKSSCSPIVKEGLDASASLFTLDGTTLAQACAIPIHLATLIPSVAEIRRVFPPETMQDGDIYLLNDPYCGGTHLPDIAVVIPVFARGRLLALAATMTHHQDVGGLAAGSVPTNATEIFQEGLRIPAIRWARGGAFDPMITAILRQNVRIPDIFMGDLHAQVAACRIACIRLQQTAEKYGHNSLMSAFGLLIERAETMTRAALREIPPGTYRHIDWLDNDGIELDRRLRVEVAVTVAGGDIHFDLTGTSPQARGPVNCVPSGSLAAACFAVRAVTDPSIPNNGGCFRPISLTLPEGSLVNPRSPAPVNARSATIKRITGCMLSALATVLPERVPAPSAGELLVMAFGGRRRDGAPFVTGELLGGGSGAGRGFDGVDAIETDATNCMNLPAEAMELEAPIRIRRWSLCADSGGAGEFRGGLGQLKEYEILDDLDGALSFSHRGERHVVAASGMAGGGDGAKARSVIHRRDGSTVEIPSKMVTELSPGDRVIIETAGGAGWGPPARRSGEALAADIANGKVSTAEARRLDDGA
ncbi:MAG: 5-oxoprolinase [Geminicoccaceae bacterium]|jgi:N-methylhydantoinase B/oxoprolinase/acetone carboxylase alpha subunit|nr:5-oxoprolinase [Geminicoccaceae bacterium]